MDHRELRDKNDGMTLHPNIRSLIESMRRIGFGRITEITVANGVPLKFRVEQLVDLSKGEEPSLDP